MHYNPPAWGNLKAMGYGTWVCRISKDGKGSGWELWCGIQNDVAYIRSGTAPFNAYPIKGSFNALAEKRTTNV